MAINNYIKDMQNHFNAKQNFQELFKEFKEARNNAKNSFIYKSVSDYLGRDDLSLDEAKEFVANNNVSFNVTEANGNDEKWVLTIENKQYKTSFGVNFKNNKKE